MEENLCDRIADKDHAECPVCGKNIKLDLNSGYIDERLEFWFEGLCLECCDISVIPLPVLADMSWESRLVLWRIIGN